MAPHSLTLEAFREQYKDLPYEYWQGNAVKKSRATWLHSLLQVILAEFLSRAGYSAGAELDLRLDPNFEPRPDVAAGRKRIPTNYPTERGQIEIVVEILSPDDSFSGLVTKCAEYARVGIEQVYVADPESEIAWQWDRERRQLTRTDDWHLTNGEVIQLEDAWIELRKRARRGEP